MKCPVCGKEITSPLGICTSCMSNDINSDKELGGTAGYGGTEIPGSKVNPKDKAKLGQEGSEYKVSRKLFFWAGFCDVVAVVVAILYFICRTYLLADAAGNSFTEEFIIAFIGIALTSCAIVIATRISTLFLRAISHMNSNIKSLCDTAQSSERR